MPGEAAGSDDAPDDWFGVTGQFLIIDFDEAVCGQHAPPMIHEPLVAAEICDQFVASGRERQAGMEMCLMNRQGCVDGSSAAMNDQWPAGTPCGSVRPRGS